MTNSIIHLLNRARQLTHDDFLSIKNESRSSLTPTQFILLSAIRANPGVSQTVLVRTTGTDRSTLADVVRRMMQNGLISRKRDESDGRAYRVDLTNEGRIALEAAELAAQRLEVKLESALGQQGVSRLAQSLESLIEVLEPAAQTAKTGPANLMIRPTKSMTQIV